jgi:hypothetical protein
MSEGRIYTVSFTAIAVTVAVDIFELTPADDKPIQVLGILWGQSSDVGDVAAEQIGYRVIRGFTSAGSGGATTTPQPTGSSAGAAAGFTAKTNNPTVATTGTTADLHSDVINLQAGLQLWLPEGLEWGASQTNITLVVRLAAAPADSITTHGTLYVRELG